MCIQMCIFIIPIEFCLLPAVPDKFAVEILDSVSLVHHQKLPAPVLQVTLVPHANLIRRHHHREKWLIGCRFGFLSGAGRVAPHPGVGKHISANVFSLCGRAMIEYNRDLRRYVEIQEFSNSKEIDYLQGGIYA